MSEETKDITQEEVEELKDQASVEVEAEETPQQAPMDEQPSSLTEEEDEAVAEEDKSNEELEVLTSQVSDLEDKVLRLQAEIANMHRIHTREKQDAAKFRSQNLASSLLEVVDNLERALSTEVTSEDGQNLKKGVEMVYNQFKQAFENEKIETIDPLNEAFDPNFHQAVTLLPKEEGQDSNQVVQVLQKGYRIDNRVIRPAMVIVTEE